jgi:glyoxylase-like metal-dependent hydrolase (beta-lactamase superfamily II)
MVLHKIKENILYSPPDETYDQPCLYAIVGNERTLMIDGGVSVALAKEFTDALQRETGRGVDYVAVTHWHWDHVFGLAGIDAPVLACRNTAEHLKEMAGYTSWADEALDERVRLGQEIFFCALHIKETYPGESRGTITIRQPDIVFDGPVSLNLGGVTCNLLKLPLVHTNDSIAIHVPEERVLFIGDSACQNSYDQPAHFSAPAVLALMDIIKGLDADIIAESHVEPCGPVEFWQNNSILEDAARGILAGCTDQASLMAHLRSISASNLPDDDVEKLVELFINGLHR